MTLNCHRNLEISILKGSSEVFSQLQLGRYFFQQVISLHVLNLKVAKIGCWIFVKILLLTFVILSSTFVVILEQAHKMIKRFNRKDHRKTVVDPWECWNENLLARCPPWHQPALIREEMLESGHLFSESLIWPPYLTGKILNVPLQRVLFELKTVKCIFEPYT